MSFKLLTLHNETEHTTCSTVNHIVLMHIVRCGAIRCGSVQGSAGHDRQGSAVLSYVYRSVECHTNVCTTKFTCSLNMLRTRVVRMHETCCPRLSHTRVVSDHHIGLHVFFENVTYTCCLHDHVSSQTIAYTCCLSTVQALATSARYLSIQQ